MWQLQCLIARVLLINVLTMLVKELYIYIYIYFVKILKKTQKSHESHNFMYPNKKNSLIYG